MGPIPPLNTPGQSWRFVPLRSGRSWSTLRLARTALSPLLPPTFPPLMRNEKEAPQRGRVLTHEIATLSAGAAQLQQVMDLWRVNSRTLGFLPLGAFTSYAEAGGVLVATCGDELALIRH